MEDVESRFLHFLQPIRDLAKNWEVDVAAQLGEYLEELDQICISFDGGKTTMNFIEAALLIQGSACIYSKKVESLYSLVYQALDFISNKKREKQPASVGQDGVDKDVSAGPEEEKFLNLDDIQDTSRANMDLRDDHRHSVVTIVPLTPMALVPPEEADKKDNPLFSRKGEILASQKDFRLNTCTPHANGAFMLELAGLSPTQCQPVRNCEWDCGNSVGAPNLPPAAGSTPMEGSVCEMPVLALNFSGDGEQLSSLSRSCSSAVDSPTVPFTFNGAAGDAAVTQQGTWQAADAADPACDDDNCDYLLPGVPNEDMDVSTAGIEHVAHQMGAPQRKGYMLREKPPAQDANAHIKEVLDPWRSLDPFGSSDEKPLKKGRPFTVPRGLDTLPGTKRKRRLSGKLQEFTKWFSAMEHNGAGNRSSKRKGPSFADLEFLYWKQMKERLAAQRKLQRRMQGPLFTQPFEEFDLVEEEREDDGLDNADDGGADDFLEHEDIPALEAPEEVPESMIDPAEVPSSLSYEELVRKNVELFMAHSQKYARETVLSRRIRDWEDMMGPQLEEQEARAAFDIHSYGDRLVSSLGRVGEWHSFASLVAGQPAFDVCRCMLASLQLANDYTVEISQKPGLENAVDTMALRLLTQERAHERFHTYMAPSLS